MKARPVIRDKDTLLQTDFVQEALDGCIITPAPNPGQSSPYKRIIGFPEPEFYGTPPSPILPYLRYKIYLKLEFSLI